MPKSYLWSLDNDGYVYFLSTWDDSWSKLECASSKISRFRKLAASQWSVWAIGCDQEVYLYVQKSDTMIRVVETLTECQRRQGGIYHAQYLRQDDPPGMCLQTPYGKAVRADKKSVRLPSTRWSWEGDWELRRSYDGKIPQTEGWLYSSHFHLSRMPTANELTGLNQQSSQWLSSDNQMKTQRPRLATGSAVRQREWQRHRYFSACDRWLLIGGGSGPRDRFQISCSLSPSREGEQEELLAGTEVAVVRTVETEKAATEWDGRVRDVACGGEMLPHQRDGYVSVWAVDFGGQVLYRLNVHRLSPEGQIWCTVTLPKHVTASAVSVGPLGHVLVCSSEGKLFFREGVSWKNPIGMCWLPMSEPELVGDVVVSGSSEQDSEAEKIVQTELGVYSVWARSNLGRVWLRENVNLHLQPTDRAIGQFWMSVLPPLQCPGTDVSSSGDKTAEVATTGSRVAEISVSPSGELWGLTKKSTNFFYKVSTPFKFIFDSFWSGRLDVVFETNENTERQAVLTQLSASALYLDTGSTPPDPWIHSKKTQTSSTRNGHLNDDNEPNFRTQIMEALILRDTLEYKNPLFCHFTPATEQVAWSKSADCEACSSSSDSATPYKWLPASVTMHQRIKADTDKATLHVYPRKSCLGGSQGKDVISFVNCDDVICVSKAEAPTALVYHRNLPNQCTLLSILMESKTAYNSPLHATCNVPRLFLSFSSETEVEEWISTLYRVCPATQRQPIILQPLADPWTNHSAAFRSNALIGSTRRMWFLNQLHEPFVSQVVTQKPRQSPIERWRQDGGHFRLVESGGGGHITWAVGFNGVAWANCRKGRGGSYLPVIGQPSGTGSGQLGSVSDTRTVTVIEYERLRFMQGLTFGTFSPYMWVDGRSDLIRDCHQVTLSSRHWRWEGEWIVDHSGGAGCHEDGGLCDPEGWQYSTNLGHRFDNKLTWSKKFRRRFWRRSYKTSTIGPWCEVAHESIKIADISIAPVVVLPRNDTTSAPNQSKDADYHVWAVTEEGDLMRRREVSYECPEGVSWAHIRTSVKLFSVSISCDPSLWAVCSHGHVRRLLVPLTTPSGPASLTLLTELDWDVVRHPHPTTHKFIQCSVGSDTSVWAVDSSYDLWVLDFPETPPGAGVAPSLASTRWILVEHRVAQVSCHSHKQVWVVFLNGNIAARTGLSDKNPRGVSWNYKIRGIGSYICCRGQ